MPDYDEFDNISEEAARRLRAASRGVQGQVVRREHGVDYWVYVVTKEWLAGDAKPST